MKPRKHQQDAIRKIVSTLKGTDTRVTIAMACGSGKTLVGARAVEALLAGNESAKVVVFVPSLPLLDQIANDWVELGAFGGDFIMLPVASVGSSLYGEDSVDHLEGVTESSLSNLETRPDIRANTTQSGEIAEVLKEDRRVVVFCTYQSSERIKDALDFLPGFSFDAAVMDEAHRTAGAGKVDNSPWQMCLQDDDIRIDRRLFMTATPRVHKARKSAKKQKAFNTADDLLEEYIDHGVSMEDEAAYGKLAYEFSFAEAIGAGILSDYKIWVVAVSDKDIREAARSNNKVNLDHVDLQRPDPSELEAVASARNLAVIAAVGKMATRGIVSGMLSFHSNTAKSRRFTKDASGYLAAHPNAALAQSLVQHVDGNTPQQDRLKIMDAFEAAHRKSFLSLLSNCAVLTEGLDLPELNSILFADPKRSKISIVQAVGRAIRLDPNSPTKLASVIIPVFIGDQEDPEEMVNSSAFEKLHEIILALRENDNMSAYFSDAIKADSLDKENDTETKANMFRVLDDEGDVISGPEDGSDTPITIIAPGSAGKALEMSDALVRSYRKFTKACQSKVVGQYASPFERNLAMLKVYKEKHQHCNMRKGAKIESFPIGNVVYGIRDRFYDGDLPENEAAAYEAVGLQLKTVDEIVSTIDSVLASING